MSEAKRKTRHFHAGKLRKTIGVTEFVEVAESNGGLFVSRDGAFTSKTRGWRTTRGYPGRGGYLCIAVDGVKSAVARVVYEVFVEQIPDGMEIDHIDAVRHHNDVSNLRAVTRRDNLLNPITRGRRRIACAANGAKGVAAQDRGALMRNLALGWEAHKRPVVAEKDGVVLAFPTAKDAAVELGLTAQAICHALKGRTKKCGGYVWKYAEVHNV